MLDRLTSMQVFTRAASAGSLSAAARQLGISPAMAAKHLDALETRLGVRLFHRSTRKLTLTEAGQQYLEACGRILPELDEAEALVSSQRSQALGVLRLNTPLSFGVRYIAPLLPEFSRQHPGVVVDLGLNDRVVDLMEEGWDLTIRIGWLKDSRLVSRKLADVDMLVCAAPEYWAQHGRPARWAELAGHNCMSFTLSRLSRPGEWRYGRAGEQSVAVRGTLQANNGDALLAAAVAGLGVLYEPAFIVAEAIRRGELEPVTLDAPAGDQNGIHLVRAADRMPPAKVRVMTEFLVRAFQPTPPWSRLE